MKSCFRFQDGALTGIAWVSFWCGLMSLTSPLTQAAGISYQRDAAGRVLTAVYSNGATTAYTYDKPVRPLSRTHVAAPFAYLGTTYAGLITSTTPGEGVIGVISFTLSTTGKATGKVTLGATSVSFVSQFDTNGNTTPVVIALSGSTTLTLALDLDGTFAKVTGTLSGGVNATIDTSRAMFGATRLVPGGLALRYTSVLAPTQMGSTIPQGNGYATVVIGTTGAITLSGKLADGTALTHSATLVGDGAWAFYVSLYANKGRVGGLVNLQNIPTLNDFTATVNWNKPATTTTLYPAAFNTTLDFHGALYTAPMAGFRALDFKSITPNATLTYGSYTSDLTLATTNLVTYVTGDVHKPTLVITTTTGVFTGSFMEGTIKRITQGVLDQARNEGRGYYLDAAGSQPLQLQARP